MKPFYALSVKDDVAELYIYGDIASDGFKWSSSDISSNDVIKQLEGLSAAKINVYINSYGGEVAEGLAIYNILKRSKAKVTTICDGFACSIASVIFMAGDVRQMNSNSLLMIHNAWTCAEGNAEQLIKQAEDLKTINETVKKAYLEKTNLSDEELNALLDKESWLTPEKALELGFATEVSKNEAPNKASASAAAAIFKALTLKEDEPSPEDEPDDTKAVIEDIVSRLEKLEEAVFSKGKDPDSKEPESKNYMEKFLNSIMK